MARPARPTNEMLGFVEDEYGALSIGDIVISPPPVATLSHDVPDKRLIIYKLKIKNFKSYAGELELGPFNKNFTAVVGPNGSGKSNVIDSLLFVFGYRAKKIRSKKVSHLIHKSDQHPNVNSCSVTVHFGIIREKGDSYEIVPGTDFVLSRTAFADDSSYYEMDNKRSPYKEVARALRRYGIDLEHSRFLILQGEIEAISLMQPKGPNEHECGMLEYIEDIIGSNRYIEPIQKLREKLEKLTEEKKEKFHNLKLVEKEKEDLEGPKNKAVEYLRLENRIILNENSLLQYSRHAAEKGLKKIQEDKKEFQEKLAALKAEISEIRNSRKTEEKDLEKLNRELDHHVSELEKYKEVYKTLERQDVAMYEEIKHIKAKKTKIENSLASTKSELEKLRKQAEVYGSETTELEKMREKMESEKGVEEKKLSQVMDSMQSEIDVLQEKKDKLEADLIRKKKIVYNSKSEMELLQSELDIYTRTDKKEKQALSNMIYSHEKAVINSKEEELLLQKEKEQIVTLQKDQERLEKEICESREKEIQLLDQLKAARLKLEEARNSLTSYNHRSGLLQAFAKEKASGRMPGIFGRLGDLGCIDEKYDVAISTACSQLDNIVTDTTATAEKCVQFLKQHNLGYITFIPLERMKRWIPHTQRKISTPENAPRLFDLVRVKDERMLSAFYFALQDTLVANDLDQATRIGLQGARRFRVVTLKGDLIDLSGTMSGGGGRVFQGRIGQTVVDQCSHTPEDVKRIKQEVDALQEATSHLRKLLFRLEEELGLKRKELSRLTLSVRKRDSNCKAYQDSAEMLQIQIEQQKEKMENSCLDEDKVVELTKKIEAKKQSYQESLVEAHDVEQVVSKLQDEILKITKGSFSKVKKTVDLLTKKIAEVTQSITKSAVNSKNCKRNMKKAEDKIKTLEKELESAAQVKMTLDANRESSVKKAKDFIEKQNKAQVAVDELKEKKIELKKGLKVFDEKEQKLKLDEINMKNKFKEFEGMESEKQSAVKSYANRLSKLKLNEVGGDSVEIPSLTVDEIERLPVKKISSELELLKLQLEDMEPNLSVIAEYNRKEKLCHERQTEYDDTVKERNLQNMRCDELCNRRFSEFMKGFTAIAKKLKETYQMLTLGGDAEMELVDTFDPFSKGIEFSVRPPRKSWKFMRNLSGGEKTLSSLALVFALHYYRPTPFYVMDEIDAALDVRNVAIVGFYLKECTKNTQFIIVSLRNIMNELSDHLIGIYKIDNCSKHISIQMTSKWKEEDEASAGVRQP